MRQIPNERIPTFLAPKRCPFKQTKERNGHSLCFFNWTTVAAPLQAIVVSVLPEFYLAEKQTTNKTDIKAKMTKTHF